LASLEKGRVSRRDSKGKKKIITEAQGFASVSWETYTPFDGIEKKKKFKIRTLSPFKLRAQITESQKGGPINDAGAEKIKEKIG